MAFAEQTASRVKQGKKSGKRQKGPPQAGDATSVDELEEDATISSCSDEEGLVVLAKISSVNKDLGTEEETLAGVEQRLANTKLKTHVRLEELRQESN